MDSTSSFGEWLRRRRRALDLTRDELALQVGCAAATIKKIESDERRPSRQLAERLAMCLDIPPADQAAFLKAARAELAVDRLASPPETPSSPPPPRRLREPRAAPQKLRGYTLHEQLGAGGFGAVYRGTQPGVGREVAIKVIQPEYADHPDFIRRFEAEAQLVARLEHPHIVPLYDFWRESGGAYLVMRYIRAGSLQAVLQAGAWSLSRSTRLLDQVASALAFAHRHGVVHRDLKPANILLDEDGHAYLADFGIAKELLVADEVAQTQPDAVVGSPDYLTPEQIKAEPITPQTDLYSLGVLLYQVLIGAQPFAHLSPTERLYKQLHDPLPALDERRPDLPAALNAVIQRATAKQPADRYPDVASMVVAWQQALALPGAVVSWLETPTEITLLNSDVVPLSSVMAAVDDLTVTQSAVVENPYKGLRAFGEADAADFFGRTALTQQLLERLAVEDTEARFLAVVGPSGSGKSSVVRAGLLPALRRGGLPGSEQWFVIEMLPGAHPLEELEAALLRIAVNPPESLLGQLREDERGLARAVKRVLPANPAIELVLIIDQFEELFTLTEDEAARAHFVASLCAAVLDPHSRLRVVATLRADFYDRPLLYPDFAELMRERTEVVLPLAPEELEQAIVGPAARVGVRLEANLVAAIVKDVDEQPGALPLLQYALTELFERRMGRLMRLDAYRESGGVLGALARRADAIYTGLDAPAQDAARQLFLRLITLGEGIEDTRRRVLRSELTALTNDARHSRDAQTNDDNDSTPSSAMDAVIDRYGRARLLTFDRDPITRGPTVEIAHEALIRNWERLRDWLEASRDDLRVQRRLMTAASDWANAGRDASFLASGARLAQFAALTEAGNLALNAEEAAYIETSLAERARLDLAERERRAHEFELARQSAAAQHSAARRLRYLVGALALFLVAAIGLTTFAFNQRSAAKRTARLASARELAASAISSLNRDPESSILLALQAVTTTYALDHTVLPEAEQALHRAVQASRVRLTFANETSAVMTVAFSPDGTRLATIDDVGTVKVRDTTTGNVLLTLPVHTSHNGSRTFQRLAFSPDGTRLATCANERGVIVWNVASGQAQLTVPNTDELCSTTFSPDGKRLASGSGSGAVKLWDAATGKELLTLSGHTDVIAGIAFSPDGTRLATASWDNTVRLWDVATGKTSITLSSNSYVTSVAFSPDGTRLAAASGETTLSIWDSSSGKLLNQFTSLSPQAVAFSPDGARLAIGTFGGTASLLDAATGTELLTLAGHTDELISVAFSPDGTRLATASLDKTTRVWDITADREVLTFSQPSGINRVAFSPDGTRLITGNDDSAVHVWDTRTGQGLLTLSGHTIWVVGVAFSPDGTRIATASETAKVWDAASGELLLTLSGHAGPVRGVAFSSDGTRIATASFDETAKIWDAATGKLLLTFPGHGSWARSVAYSPDGTRIAVPYDDGTAKVWDATTGKEELTLSGHTAQVWAIAFNSNSDRIATASVDRTAKVWDAATGKVLLTLTGHTGPVYSVAFSPDGSRIATASGDKTAKVWDATTGSILHTLPGHAAAIYGVAFSPDGTRIATASGDGTARIYLLRVEELIALAKSRVTRSLRTEECQQYLHLAQCPPLP